MGIHSENKSQINSSRDDTDAPFGFDRKTMLDENAGLRKKQQSDLTHKPLILPLDIAREAGAGSCLKSRRIVLSSTSERPDYKAERTAATE